MIQLVILKKQNFKLAIKNNFSFLDYIFISVCKIDMSMII